MTGIYKPKGKAGEYAELAINLYRGCDHGCTYCYAPAVTHKDKDTFHEKVYVRHDHKHDIIHLLDKQGPAYRDKEVLMCFTSDPYSPGAVITGATRRALLVMYEHGIIPNILTKGGLRAVPDYPLLAAAGGKIGATLTFTKLADSKEYEPHATSPAERFMALRIAKEEFGLYTWASLEPVIFPEQTLEIIRRTHKYIDLFKIGKWNYDARANKTDWAVFGLAAESLCKELGVDYYIKADLRKEMEG